LKTNFPVFFHTPARPAYFIRFGKLGAAPRQPQISRSRPGVPQEFLMKTRTLFLLAVLTSLAAFAALNWDAFIAPSRLSVGVASVQAPLGLIMLGLVVLLAALFLAFVLYWQTTVLLDARRHAKDLRSNRELADRAEASRFTELHVFLATELRKLSLRDEAAQAVMLNRIEQAERELRAAVQRSENKLAGQIASPAPLAQHSKRAS
jgi:hypothetical protein